MSESDVAERLALKTPEAAFLHVLRHDYNFSQRVAHAVLETAQELLAGGPNAEAVRPGQIRLVVARQKAAFGPALADTAKVEVTLTVDTGVDDAAVHAAQGLVAQRQGRILRLVEEALEQGGVLTEEDLGRALGVSARTIRRDAQTLKEEGHLLLTRGRVCGVGRGQTHKARIIELWLQREGYDQIARRMYHSPQSIKRYISTFLRVVVLHEEGIAGEEIAFLTGCSVHLVGEYLRLYEEALAVPSRREKLEEEWRRVAVWERLGEGDEKKGATR